MAAQAVYAAAKLRLADLVADGPRTVDDLASVAGMALMDLMMLTLVAGHERTEAQFNDLLASAGFVLERIIPTPRGSSVIEARRR